jgi:hypothetical protein
MFFPEKVHHTSLSDGLTLHTRVALSQKVKFGEMCISRISNFVSENTNNSNLNLYDGDKTDRHFGALHLHYAVQLALDNFDMNFYSNL